MTETIIFIMEGKSIIIVTKMTKYFKVSRGQKIDSHKNVIILMIILTSLLHTSNV